MLFKHISDELRIPKWCFGIPSGKERRKRLGLFNEERVLTWILYEPHASCPLSAVWAWVCVYLKADLWVCPCVRLQFLCVCPWQRALLCSWTTQKASHREWLKGALPKSLTVLQGIKGLTPADPHDNFTKVSHCLSVNIQRGQHYKYCVQHLWWIFLL